MPTSRDGLPIVGLLALSTTAFLTILTETMPAALLPLMAADLGQGEGQIGMLVGVYAMGAAVASIPIIAATRAVPRRLLLVLSLALFCVANFVTAQSASYAVIVTARIVAGVTSGVVWPMVAGYAVRLADGRNVGRAISIAMAGSAVAMAIGLPMGSVLGDILGWRATFGILGLVALLLIGWVMVSLPPVAAMPKENRTSVYRVGRLPGLPLVLTMAGIAMLGHYTLYTYIAPLSDWIGILGGTTTVLLVFGAGAIIGVIAAGRLVDRHLRWFGLGATAMTVASMIFLIMVGGEPSYGAIAIFLWGLSFGGMPTLIQSAASHIAREESELATAMIATIYNAGIFAGSAAGGAALAFLGMPGLLCIVMATMVIAFSLIMAGKRYAFP